MKVLINYANEAYRQAQKWNTWTGKHIARFDKVFEFTPKDIADEYCDKHRDIFSISRGNGLWLWKPYFIDKVLNECDDGDVICYVDSGAFFVKRIDKLIASFREQEKIWVSDCPLLESCFTKSICFKELDCDTKDIKNSNQIQATYLMMICCEETKKFVKEWLYYCENLNLMSPEGGLALTEKRGVQFVAHREDQSILSLLCKKKGIQPHKDPSQRGRYPQTFYNDNYAYCVPEHKGDNYGTVIFLHKAKRPSFYVCIRVLLLTIRSRFRYKKAEIRDALN